MCSASAYRRLLFNNSPQNRSSRNVADHGPSTSKGRSRGGGGKVVLLGTAGVLACGVAYFYYIDEDRWKQLTSQLNDSFSTGRAAADNVSLIVKDRLTQFLPKKKETAPDAPQIDLGPILVSKSVESSTAEKEEAQPEPISPFQAPVAPSIAQSDQNKDDETRREIVVEDKEREATNKALVERIQQAISSAEKKLNEAVEAKRAAILTLDQHSDAVFEAVENSTGTVIFNAQKSNWDEVEAAAVQVKRASDNDWHAESGAKNYFDMLRQVINNGQSSPKTADNPILRNAAATLNSLVYQLDAVVGEVNKVRRENVITANFKELVEKGRERFASELQAILPHVTLGEKGKKLSEDELNALIAHAHMRVDELRRQLSERQAREEQLVEEARQRQKAEDTCQFEERLDMELRRHGADAEVETERKLQGARSHGEEELRAQLRRAAAAHSEHLEEVLRVQKEKLERDYTELLGQRLAEERSSYEEEMASALGRLQGIETALDGRAVQDSENRRAKELWLACQNLVESVQNGRRGGYDMQTRRKPLANELMTIREASENNPFVNLMSASFDDEALRDGVYTKEDLKTRFLKVYRLCRRTAMIGEDGGGLLLYLLSTLQSFFIVDFWRRGRPTSDDEHVFDRDSADVFELLSRARRFVIDDDDFASAVRLLLLLSGSPARVAADWIRDARLHLETKQTADLLMSHAAATSMRTVY